MSEDKSFWNLFCAPEEDRPAEPDASESSSFWDLFCKEPVPGALVEEEPPNCATAFNQAEIFWAMRNLPVEEAMKHFVVCGTTGSGKTIAIQLLLQSIAPRFRIGSPTPEQLIIFDAKCDTVPTLAALGLRPEDENVSILNPFDARSAVWSVSEAVQTPAMARALATLLVPEEKNSTAPYFSNAARELVYDVVLALNHVAGTDWTLRDLLCALESRENIAAVTGRCPRAGILAARILDDKQHSPGVLSTLATKLGPFEQVAALWNTCKSGRKFSIPDFLSRPGVLILGNDPVLRESFWPINAMLLKALANEILRRPNTRQPRHWFVLDEFRAMERVDCIHDLLNRGRSKGAAVLLGIQSVEGLLEIYGENGANDILSQCANKMFLRAGGPKTAEWIERVFNRVRQTESTISISDGHDGRSTTTQYAIHERSLFLASFFLDIPFPGRGRPYVAVCDVPFLRETLIVRRHSDELFSWLHQPGDNIHGVDARTDISGQSLVPWDPDEERRFCGESFDQNSAEVKPAAPDSEPSDDDDSWRTQIQLDP
ncbi:MAG: type IV secretion system DNA-binding domain-containing protein [Verrucomicrobia bacterium]|nr:type IV secretion system DNA-binding domain-containing protein [Verrucomicrobiota bacterium]